MSFFKLLYVFSEIPICFAICFRVSLESENFLSMNFNINFCLKKRRFEFESKFCHLEAESILKKEEDT